MKKLGLLAAAVFSLASCQQEELSTKAMYNDDVMSSLKFKTVTATDIAQSRALAETDQFESFENVPVYNAAGLNIGIFSVRIARPSTGCKRGFGFCDFKWFPKQEFKAEFLEEDLYKQSFVIQQDDNGNYFVDLELAEKPVGLEVDKLQPLVVEERLESFATVDNKEASLAVPVGQYKFEKSVGDIGGYRVMLEQVQ